MAITRRALPALAAAIATGPGLLRAEPAVAATEIPGHRLEFESLDESRAVGVNDAGQVLIQGSMGLKSRTYLRSPAGALVRVSTANGDVERALLNERGQVAGLVGDDAVLWDRGATHLLPVPGSGVPPTAFNARGQVLTAVGPPVAGADTGGKDVYLVDARSARKLTGGFVAPPNFFGQLVGDGVATILNDRGQAVVSGFEPSGHWRVVRYDAAGRPTQVTLPVDWPSVQWLELSNLNRDGDFAVNVVVSDDGLQTATYRGFACLDGQLTEVVAGGGGAWLRAINNHQVGVALDVAGESVYLWSRSATTWLGPFLGPPLLVNDRDMAVLGASAWRRGALAPLGPAGADPMPAAMNNRGLVVGQARYDSHAYRATAWPL